MLKRISIILLGSILYLSNFLLSSDAFLMPAEYEKINDHLYKITVDAGDYSVNSLISAGPDGVLFIDSGLRQSIPEYKRILKELNLEYPDIIINSHFHVDHTGGNIEFGKKAKIYGHPTIETRLSSPRYAMYGYTPDAFPNEVITSPKVIRFNGDRIWVIPMEGAHSGSDLAIYFEKSDVAYLGDIAYGMMLPSADGTDGDVTLYPDVIRHCIESIGANTRIVSGHGKDCSPGEMMYYANILESSIEIVSEQLDSGQTVSAIVSNGSLDKFSPFANDSYTSTAGWVNYIYNGINHTVPTPRASDEIYPVLRDKGVEAAIHKFEEMEMDQPDQYTYDALTFYILIINYLQPEGLHKEAIELANYTLEKYPDWDYNWIILDALGGSYHELNKKSKAIEFYKASLDEYPNNKNAEKHLLELTG